MRRIATLSLLSSLAFCVSAAHAAPASDAAVTAITRPVSTGVTSPRLVHSTKINISADEVPTAADSHVTLTFNLDQTGTPRGIHVTHSVTQAVDARVVAAVRQFRWTPAVLNNQTVPIEMNFTVQVQR